MTATVVCLTFITLLGISGAQELLGSCTTTGVSSTKLENVTTASYLSLSGALPASLGSVHTCRIAIPDSPSLLQVTAKTESTTPGSLHVDVYEPDKWTSIGRLTVSSTSLPGQNVMCTSGNHHPGSRHHYITFSGTPGLYFAAEVQTKNATLQLNDKKNFTINKNWKFIFMFTPNSSDITNSQLDVTVTSQDRPVAYLAVSYSCGRVNEKSQQIVDTTKPSMVLTFQHQGRITLSRVSKPKLDNRTLFIGVYMHNNEHGNKTINIELKKSFTDYDYTTPLSFLFFTALIGGIIIALWALFCFRESLTLVDETGLDSTGSLKTTPRYSFWKRLTRCRDFEDSDEMEPLIRAPRRKAPTTAYEILRAMCIVLKDHWLGLNPKTFSYLTCIVGCVLLVGAFQFVYENWFIMIDDGDRDKCFYNDFCYRVGHSDMPFNLMISNLAYMIHAFILVISVWVMEAELYVQAKKKAQEACKSGNTGIPSDRDPLPNHLLVCRTLEAHLPQLSVPKYEPKTERYAQHLYACAYKSKYSFSLGYAFAWSLLFEGLFSTTYHLCPTKMTFQFDSAFMLVIGGLIILSLYNGFSVKTCTAERRDTKPVDAAVFFLFVITPLFILNYLGSLYNADIKFRQEKIPDDDSQSQMSKGAQAIFIVLMIIWYVAVILWAGYKLFYSVLSGQDSTRCSNVTKLTLFTVTVLCTCVAFPLVFYDNLSDMLLFSAIASSMLSVLGKVIIEAASSVPSLWDWRRVVFRLFQILYIFVFLAFMAVAVYVFLGVPTSNKAAKPAMSRNLNKDCVLFDFFDDHDVWHILSSFSLLMGAFLVMFISG